MQNSNSTGALLIRYRKRDNSRLSDLQTKTGTKKLVKDLLTTVFPYINCKGTIKRIAENPKRIAENRYSFRSPQYLFGSRIRMKGLVKILGYPNDD